jgi:hypothetical protein
MSRVARFAAGASLLLLAAACGDDYGRLEIGVVDTTFVASTAVNKGHITVTEGSITNIRLAVFDDDGENMKVRCEVSDTTKVDFASIVNTEENYAIIAKELGRSSLRIFAEGDKILTINIDVVPQPTPP